MDSGRTSDGWGDSVLVKLYDLIRDYDTSWAGVSAVMQDYAQTIFKLKGLADAIASGRENYVAERMRLIDMSRSTVKAVLLDQEGEDFSRVVTPVSGVSDLMAAFADRIAAAAGIPAVVLFGQSPAGLAATGASDIRFFYDSIRSGQRRDCTPVLSKIVKLLLLTSGGEPENWGIKYRSLWQPTDSEKAEVRLKMAQVDRAYIDMGVLNASDVLASRFAGDEYSLDTTVETA
jgi:phage-related protein (TIGR01555 family)